MNADTFGNRTVTVEGSANSTVVVTGDYNQIALSQGSAFAYHPIDEQFRDAHQRREPADFYGGTRPNWANIACDHDARRDLQDVVLDFVTGSTSTKQRIGVITAASGEGKTTLLMRVAWELSKMGYLVLWRHRGHVLPNFRIATSDDRCLVLCFDEIAYDTELVNLVADLADNGLPFVILGTARSHDWQKGKLSNELGRTAQVHEFLLGHLSRPEVERLLERLSAADALGTMATQSHSQRVNHLLQHLQAGSELLPAMLSAQRGQAFGHIISSVFDSLAKRSDVESTNLLLNGYAGIALVHRFGFAMTRTLLARYLNVAEAELKHRLIYPLQGELLELTESDVQGIYTRHPIIAETALQTLVGRYLPEELYLYAALFKAITQATDSGSDSDEQEHRLLTSIPLAIKRSGDIQRSRSIFNLAAQACPSDASIYYHWAQLEKEQNQIQRARELFQQAANADIKYAPVYNDWGLLEKELRHLDQAQQIFAQAAYARIKYAPVYYNWGVLESELGHVELARQLFRIAIKMNPRDVTAYHLAATFERDQKQYERAREIYQRGAVVIPGNSHLFYVWALFEKEQGQLQSATALLETSISITSTHSAAYQALISMEKERGHTERARDLFRQAVKVNPNSAYLYLSWAILEKEQQNVEQARELYQKAALLDTNPVLVYHSWALLEKEQGKYARAEELFQLATDSDACNPLIYQAWAILAKEQGQVDRARELFQQAAKFDSTNAHVYQAWAILEKEQGQLERARELFRLGAKADPHNALVYHAWAMLEQEQNEIERARSLFQQAAQANPNDAYVYFSWAVLERLQKEPQRARELFEKATQVAPRDFHAYKAWASLEKNEGHIGLAREVYMKAAKANPKNAQIYRVWAEFEKYTGELERAREVLVIGLEKVQVRQGRALLFSYLAGVCVAEEKYTEAEAYLLESLNLDEENAFTHYYFAKEVLLRLGRQVDACQHLLRAKSLASRNREIETRIDKSLARFCKDTE